ncbi:MAG: hypothetical protein NC094_13835 [Bacteroidales bacterium]|nr:hypothetical protein [Lachnoclostridium sp.]MCM1383241.1 hypothetical protein [Lachnoclostridium sp.]MCM1466482.1 hypothetical protein [Bacteroidales bacterium]
MKKRMVGKLLAAVLAFAVVSGFAPALSTAAAESAEAQAETAEQADAGAAFWTAVEGYWGNETSKGALYGFWGDEEKGEKGPLQAFEEEARKDVFDFKAVDSDKAYLNVEPIKEKGAAAVTAYNAAIDAYEAVKAAYESCPADVRAEKDESNPESKSINEVWEEIQQDYVYLEENCVGQELVDYFAAWCDAYGPVRAFVGPAGVYLGLHLGDERDHDGVIDQYNKAVSEGADKEEIMQLYKKAMKLRSEALAAEPLFVEKFGVYTEAYQKMAESDKDTFGLYNWAKDDAHGRMNANLESGEVLRTQLPQVPTLSTGDVPKTKVNDNVEELVQKIDMTDEEKAEAAKGEVPVVSVSVEEVSAPDAAELEKIAEVAADAGDYSIGKHMNIEVSLQIGTSSRRVTDLNAKITLSFEMPEALLNKSAGVNRSYEIVRIHNGVASRLAVTLNAGTGMYEFESDGFSTYTIIYKDIPVEDAGENEDEDDDDTSAAQASAAAPAVKDAVRSPKTGDEVPFAGAGALLFAAAAAVCALYAAMPRAGKHLS